VSWPEGHPLPLPKWDRPKDVFIVDSVEQYEELAATVELTVQQLIQARNYNTIGNFIRFYDEFRASGESKVSNFYRRYNPPITPEHHTCVGLGLELLIRLQLVEKKFPSVAGKFYLVSCEEGIDDFPEYIRSDPSAATSEKEHVLIALKIIIGNRPGILLLDPGYHVARVITVMADHVYPHTGWFVQSDETHVRKEYCYTFAENSDYVQWLDRETRPSKNRTHGIETMFENAIYIAKPYVTAVHVTERRNLVYNFRSLLARDTKGHLIAGMYFPVKDNATCVLFYQDGNRKPRIKIPLTNSARDKEQMEAVQQTGLQLGLPDGQMELLLDKICSIMNDKDYIKQILDINRDINGISQEN